MSVASVKSDQVRVVNAFCTWLTERGWDFSTDVDFCEVMASRGDETIFAEATGRTLTAGVAIDTMYGQLLRRMPTTDDRKVRFGVVVPTDARTEALRVPEAVRAVLNVDIYAVDEHGGVEAIVAGGAAARSRSRPVINRLAYDRGELLSQEHSPETLAARQARTYEGPVGNLNRWVDTVRARTGESIPYFDPAAASDGAHVLILLQDPSQEADAGSGFISRHNNDATARNTYTAADEAGLSYDRSIHWNVVPWWVANPERQPAGRRRTLHQEAIRARPFLIELLHQMTVRPRVVILAGKEAQKAWQTLAGDAGLPDLVDLKVLECPHPSPLVYPRTDETGRRNSSVIIKKFREAAELTGRPTVTRSYQGAER